MVNKYIGTKRQSGFTIVELLIVIVVIGILAAITIVAYSGITNRANAANATATAENVSKKAEVYNADTTLGYPASYSALTGAASTASYYISGSGITLATAAMAAAPASPSTINFWKCGTNGTTTAPTTLAGITIVTGNNIGYWNYPTSAVLLDQAGIVSGFIGTFPIACFVSTT